MPKPTKTIKIGGQVIDFFEESHRYINRNTGESIKSVTSVTSILAPSNALLYWAANITKEYLIKKIEDGKRITVKDVETGVKKFTEKKQEAADIGTLVHDWISKYTNAMIKKLPVPPMPTNENILNGIMAFRKWEKENRVTFIESERPVYSSTFNYAGILDSKAIVNGKLSIIDYKTGKYYGDMRYQAAAYTNAEQEMTNDQIQDQIIVSISKEDGEFEPHHLGMDRFPQDFDVFRCCLQIAKYRDEVKKLERELAKDKLLNPTK
jgi:hypothetical protein